MITKGDMLLSDLIGLIKSTQEQLKSISFHAFFSYIFWSDWGANPKLERAELDGNNRMTLVNSSIVWPNALVVDIENGKLFWADTKLDKIETMNMDGSGRRIVLDVNVPHVFSLTLLGDRLYWTDWSQRVIQSCNKETGGERYSIIDSIQALRGIRAVNLSSIHGKPWTIWW